MEKINKKNAPGSQPKNAFMETLIKADSVSRNAGQGGISAGAVTDPDSIFSKDEKSKLTKFVSSFLSKDGKPSLDQVMMLPQLQMHPLSKRLSLILAGMFGTEKLEPPQLFRLFVIFHPSFDASARTDRKNRIKGLI